MEIIQQLLWKEGLRETDMINALPDNAMLEPNRVLQLVVRLAESEQRLKEMEIRSASLEQEVQGLRDENSRLRGSVTTLEKDLDALPKIIERAEQYRTRYKSLKSDSQEKVAMLERLLQQATESIAHLEREMASEKDNYQLTVSKWMTQLDATERQVTSARGENISLHHELARLTACAQIQQAKEAEWSAMKRGMVHDECQTDAKTVTSVACETSVTLTASTATSTKDDDVSRRHSRPSTMAFHATSCCERTGAVLDPSVMQFGLLRSSDEQMKKMIDDGEILHRHQIERQIKIHDRLLATVANLQREACNSRHGPPPLPF